jgi:hypothetical protein
LLVAAVAVPQQMHLLEALAELILALVFLVEMAAVVAVLAVPMA